jgi:hypothetical protein
MSGPKPYTGRCACGAVQYNCKAQPIAAVHCQCRACQRESGTGHVSNLIFPANAFTLTGQLKYWASTADSGNIVRRGFCEHCGSPVASLDSGIPEAVFVRAGSLDEPRRFNPTIVIYAECAQPWDLIPPNLPRFERNPDRLGDLPAS